LLQVAHVQIQHNAIGIAYIYPVIRSIAVATPT